MKVFFIFFWGCYSRNWKGKRKRPTEIRRKSSENNMFKDWPQYSYYPYLIDHVLVLTSTLASVGDADLAAAVAVGLPEDAHAGVGDAVRPAHRPVTGRRPRAVLSAHQAVRQAVLVRHAVVAVFTAHVRTGPYRRHDHDR